MNRLGTDWALSRVPNRRNPSRGAERFELRTSSPPDCSGGWRVVSGRGGKWLRYSASGHRAACPSETVYRRLWTKWGPSAAALLDLAGEELP